jgi:predicted MFS family arabinose efflux permease
MSARAARYREVFAVREFRALFAAHLLSVVGDQFARVALAVLVFDRTRSAGLTALTYALTFLPSLVAGPLLSGIADRLPRRSVMVVTDLARMVLVAAMALPGLPLLAVGALLVAAQFLAAPFNAARAATLPVILDGDRYVVGCTVSNMTYQLAQLAGFALGGVVVSGLEPTGTLLLDAATFAASAAIVRFGLRARPAAAMAPTTRSPRSRWSRDIADGAVLVWRDRRLRALVMLASISGFYVTVEGLAVPYAEDIGGGPATVGLLMAAHPAGALLGMALINRLAPEQRNQLLGPLAVAACVPLLGCALQPGLTVTLALWTLSGLASAYQVVANAEFVRSVPDPRRAQAFGLAVTALIAAQGVGVVLAGAAADRVEPAMVVALAGVLGVFAAIPAAMSWDRARVSSASQQV